MPRRLYAATPLIRRRAYASAYADAAARIIARFDFDDAAFSAYDAASFMFISRALSDAAADFRYCQLPPFRRYACRRFAAVCY